MNAQTLAALRNEADKARRLDTDSTIEARYAYAAAQNALHKAEAKPVRFMFDTDGKSPVFDGVLQGYWNGWSDVAVTMDVLEHVAAYLMPHGFDAACETDGYENAADLWNTDRRLPNGLWSLNGYCTTEVNADEEAIIAGEDN